MIKFELTKNPDTDETVIQWDVVNSKGEHFGGYGFTIADAVNDAEKFDDDQVPHPKRETMHL